MIAYVLSKNEELNIGRCLKALNEVGVKVIVLDSGSTDRTVEISLEHGAAVEHYNYVDHCTAYNEITSSHSEQDRLLVLDADMVVSQNLIEEIESIAESSDVVKVPVKMVYGKRLLRHASLCPPQPIAFKGGGEYFQPAGHGERLKSEVTTVTTKNAIVHDDRETFSDYVQKQVRYADAFIARGQKGQLTLKDRIRRRTAFGILAAPLMSLFIKGGILDGKAGILYAVDRLISEAIKYRRAIEDSIDSDLGKETN